MIKPKTIHEEPLPSTSDIKFRAAHFDIPINPLNPPPPISPSFAHLLHQTTITWRAFETAEHCLTSINDTLDAEMLDYVSAHQRATAQHLEVHRDRIAIPRYEAAIEKAEQCCKALEGEITSLEDTAQRELETVEGKATLQIDVPVMRSCLETTRQIVEVARVQLMNAKARLGRRRRDEDIG